MASRRFKIIKKENKDSSGSSSVNEQKDPDEVLAPEEESVSTMEFKAPSFEGNKLPIKGFTSRTKPESKSSSFANLMAKKTACPNQDYENPENEENMISESQLSKTGKAKTVNRTEERNSKPKMEMNLKPSEKKQVFPYLVMSAGFDGSSVHLWSVDSKSFQIRYDGDLDIEINGKEMKKLDRHGNMGYVFWKNTQVYIDKLDELFENEWRNNLKEELPTIENVEPDLLWKGMIQDIGKEAELFDYKEKSIALFIKDDARLTAFPDLVAAGAMTNSRLTYPPTDGKMPGYIIGKGSGRYNDKAKPARDLLMRSIGFDFSTKYTKSEPTKSSSFQGSGNVLVDYANISDGETTYKLSVYDSTPKCYAVVFEPDFDFDMDGFMRRDNIFIDGSNKTGYLVAKSNATAIETLKEIAPNLIISVSDESTPEGNIEVTSSVPDEPKIEVLFPKLLKCLEKMPTDSLTITESKGNIFLVGPLEKIEEYLETNELEVISNGSFNDDEMTFVMAKKP